MTVSDSFSQEMTRLLVCLKNGVVYEFEGRNNAKFDTSTSYLIEAQLSVRIFRFRSIKSKLRVRMGTVMGTVEPFVFSTKKN